MLFDGLPLPNYIHPIHQSRKAGPVVGPTLKEVHLVGSRKGIICGSSLPLEHRSSRYEIAFQSVVFPYGLEDMVLSGGSGTEFGAYQVVCLILLLSLQGWGKDKFINLFIKCIFPCLTV